MDVGLIKPKVARLSVCGELGYEINCAMDEHITLREILLEAGRASDIREFGFYAMNSLRLEKSFGVWSSEFTQAYTPGMTGLDRWIDWTRQDFIGHQAAHKEQQEKSARETLVTLEIDADDADASGYEPVWQGDRRVGFVTSGGFGHYTGKSLAMALMDRDAASNDKLLDVHVVGKRLAARIVENPPWDPTGGRMRA